MSGKPSDQALIERLRIGDDNAAKKIYELYRRPFLKWIKSKYALNNEDAKEILQISVVIIYENAISGKLSELRVNLFTYLCSIGKNKAMEWKRKNNKIDYRSDSLLFNQLIDESNINEIKEKEEKFNSIEVAMKELNKPCRKLLEMFYFYKKPMKEIAVKMGYKNHNSAKSAKKNCMDKLRNLLKE